MPVYEVLRVRNIIIIHSEYSQLKILNEGILSTVSAYPFLRYVKTYPKTIYNLSHHPISHTPKRSKKGDMKIITQTI
jgi:hypothetical protein